MQVSRPIDALEARTKVGQNLQNLLLGLGGVGIANVMVISVLERRTEIGVALGIGVSIAYANRQGWLIDIPAIGLGGVAATR